MSQLTLKDYQAQARTTYTREEQGTNEGIAYTTMGLVGEAGEIANKAKKILRGDYSAEDIKDDIAAELGDVLWYVSMVAYEFGISLEDIGEANLEKLASRQQRGVIRGSGDNR
jgi:NTP pyrophosphatase (non-canonical NTP hydrolase)